MTIVPNLEEVLEDAEAVILLVAHGEFKKMDAGLVASVMPGRVVVDTVNGWDVGDWEEAGFSLTRLGVNS